MRRSTRSWPLVSLVAVLCLIISVTAAQADDDWAASGNGGTGGGVANGGVAALGDLNSGDNVGNALGLGDTGGGNISGGSVANGTDLGIGVDGGTGIAGASGGDENIAFTLDPVPPVPEPVIDPLPPTPTPEPVTPQVCVTSPQGTSCTTVIDCFDSGEQSGLWCNIPDCSEAYGAPPGEPPLPCVAGWCEPGPNAITICQIVET